MMMTMIMTAVTADIIHEMPVSGQAFPHFVSCNRKFGNGKIWYKGIIRIMEIKQRK